MTAAAEWLVDLGNSRLKLAPVIDGRVGEVVAIAHDGEGFADGWDDALPQGFDAAWVASVAPAALTAALLDALATRGRRIHVARTQAALAGVRIAYAQPGQLGVDRFLALLAARARSTDATLLVGIGTALTIDLMDDAGLHLGGRIAPSPSLMREALHARAMQLPASGGKPVDFAADTRDALASGCEGAALGLIHDSLGAATRQLGTTPALLLHGGGASALRSRLPQAVEVPALVLEGLLQLRIAGC